MIAVRACSGFDELEACVQLQVHTWGYDASDVLPRKAFLLAQKIGGQVIGAFDTDMEDSPPQGGPDYLVGFAMAWPGIKYGRGPICTRTCWRCGRATGTAAWACA
jgi:predicted GNAT superfamily acetyltransferase